MRVPLLLLLSTSFLWTQTAHPLIEIRSITGQTRQIHPASARATAIVFVSAICPMSVDYGERLSELYKNYSTRGVTMLIVNSNVNESDAEVERQRTAAQLPYPIYRDPSARLAGTLGANATPTAVVLDAAGIVRYFGSIDDARNPARVKRENLHMAIDDILVGRTVQVARTKVLGCTIKAASVP